MITEIIINANPFEKRIAILEDNKLVELFAEKKEQDLLVGNIYKGVVRNVLPGMGAAFIDIGLSRTAFLHYKDIEPKFLQHSFDYKLLSDSSNIAKVLKAGQEIVVQVKKDPIGKKGARITGKISIPGKFLVFVPHKNKISLSRKITSQKEKDRIKSIFSKIKDKDVGIIVRTDTDEINESDFEREYNALKKTWAFLKKQIKHAKAPACLFDGNDLSYSLIRDLFSSKIDRLVIDDKKLRSKIVSNLKELAPESAKRVELYSEDSPIFDAYGIEKEIENIFRSRINLPSGGNITIQQTEALVAIDVNTGSFTGSNNYENTIKRTNVEAAYEAARQIRLRDLSGIMVIDFIDMRNEANRDEVFTMLKNSMKHDKAKHKIIPFSPLGLVEISRMRSRPSLLLSFSETCPHCNGTGRLLSRDSVAVTIIRWMKRAKYFLKEEPLTIHVHKNVKQYFEDNPSMLMNITNEIKFVIDKELNFDKFRIYSTRTNKELTEEYSS
jgi:ribonuclease G